MWGLWRLLRAAVRPGLPEPIPLAHWRRVERIGMLLPLGLALLNTVPYFLDGVLGVPLDRAAYARFLTLNLPGHAVIALGNLWARTRARGERDHRGVAMLSAAALNWTSATSLMMPGQLTLNLFLLAITVAFYRIAFDGRLGLWALLTACAGLVGVALVQAAGWMLRPFPTMVLEGTGYQHSPGARYGSLAWAVAILGTVWLLSSWLANRLRAGAHALELERAEARRTVVRALVEAGQGRLSGSTLGGYRLIELLGRGGMGEVYAGERIADGQRVAVKVLHAHLHDDATMLERFRREAEAAQRVAAHAPELFEIGSSPEDGTRSIVMERLEGEDLGAYLRRRGALPPAEVAELVANLATALEAAHGAGVVHRDLKPQNVYLVRGTATLKLLDFGISRLSDTPTGATLTHAAVVGSPGYLAPEQARGASAEIGAHTDVFALGAICYRALTGVEAFPGRTPATAIYEALQREPPPPSQLVPGLAGAVAAAVDAVLALALAKAPTLRYQRAAELATELRLALAGTLPEAVLARARALPRAAPPAGQTLVASL
ncbi:MAG: serine/threonine protein kinase [Deltaproteobacteria bacterium]|nr:serine/threonine protein kinase [Deltaproteobacteria bacterium]